MTRIFAITELIEFKLRTDVKEQEETRQKLLKISKLIIVAIYKMLKYYKIFKKKK